MLAIVRLLDALCEMSTNIDLLSYLQICPGLLESVIGEGASTCFPGEPTVHFLNRPSAPFLIWNLCPFSNEPITLFWSQICDIPGGSLLPDTQSQWSLPSPSRHFLVVIVAMIVGAEVMIVMVFI